MKSIRSDLRDSLAKPHLLVFDDWEAVHWNHVANLLSTTSGDSNVAFALP